MQKDNVSDAKSRFPSTGLSNLVVRTKFQQVLLRPTLPKVLDDLLMESEFLCQTFFKVGSDPVGIMFSRPSCRK